MSCCPKPDNTPLTENDLPSEDDLARFGGDGVTCPSCGSEVYHDASQCHACGMAISDAALAGSKNQLWIPITAGVVIVAFFFVFVL